MYRATREQAYLTDVTHFYAQHLEQASPGPAWLSVTKNTGLVLKTSATLAQQAGGCLARKNCPKSNVRWALPPTRNRLAVQCST